MRRIYLDNAATTPTNQEVVKSMQPYWREVYGNPSSVHWFGQKAKAAVDRSRKLIADFFYVNDTEIYFTSGATESNNLALKGVTDFVKRKNELNNKDSKCHVIISAIEHPAILETALNLEKKGIEITQVQPDSNGLIAVKDVVTEIKNNTSLISLMYVNNEVGAKQPVQELGKELERINQQREEKDLQKIYYHIDAVQALNYFNCRPDHLRADLMSFSGHKIYGPKGIGCLYLRQGTPLLRQMDGGQQERTLRAGTTNVSGIVGFAKAISLVDKNLKKNYQHLEKMSTWLINELQRINNIKINSLNSDEFNHIINFYIEGYVGQDLQISLDLAGIAVSRGSACSAGKTKPSPVLIAMGKGDLVAGNSIRVSIGRQNTISELKHFIKVLNKIINDSKIKK